jgi:hypothetical protein
VASCNQRWVDPIGPPWRLCWNLKINILAHHMQCPKAMVKYKTCSQQFAWHLTCLKSQPISHQTSLKISQCQLVVPTIFNYMRLISGTHRFSGQPCKLMIRKKFLNFILYFKQENVTVHDAFVWNWPTYALCGDVFFHCVVH